MLGRGLIADPSMILRLRGGVSDSGTLRRFHNALCEEYLRTFGDKNSVMHRMKAIWAYMLPRLPQGDAHRKRLVKTRRWEDFLLVTEDILKEA